jgi:hypothetical protein
MLTLILTADLTGLVNCQNGLEKCLRAWDRVTDLRPDDTPENPFWYTFKVQCTSCRETHPNYVNVSRFVCGFTPKGLRNLCQADPSLGGK